MCDHLKVKCLCCGVEASPAQLLASHSTEAKAAAARENGKKGGRPRNLICPHCKSPVTVQHLDWDAMTCQNCEKDVVKDQWLKSTAKKTPDLAMLNSEASVEKSKLFRERYSHLRPEKK